MRYRVKTKVINDKEYVTDYFLIDNYNNVPLDKYTIPKSLNKVIDDYGSFQYIVTENGIKYDPQPRSEVSKKKEYDKEIVNKINKKYSRTDEINLLNKAIDALASGNSLPKEYKEYKKYVESIKKG